MIPTDGPELPRAEAGHLTPEQLDDLAARASADLDPDQEEDRSAGITALQDHLAGCAACRSALGDQVEVSAWLRRAPDPGPMPADAIARLDAALAGAAAARPAAGARRSTSGPDVMSDSRGTVLPMAGRTGRAGALGRLAESRVTKSLVAAAAVVLIGAGGFAALHRNGSASSGGSSAVTTGAEKAPAAAPEAGLAQVRVRQSGTSYTTANIIAEVSKQLATGADAAGSGSANQPLVGADATTLTSPAGLASCLSALGAASARPLLVDLATYNGKPAAILVLPSSTNGREIWVVSRTCSPGKDGTMLFKVLG